LAQLLLHLLRVQTISPTVNSEIGLYRIVRILGKGGMGVVSEAIHSGIGRRVAIKVLHQDLARNPEFVTRFLGEARAVNVVDHPGIVQISDCGQTAQGVPYLVMEFLRGQTLSQRLQTDRGTLKLTQVLRIAYQLADALAAAHQCGIVHRDLKPENVMLVSDSSVAGGERTKLLDFGIAKVAEGQVDGHRTRTGAVMGTPLYMSPEQCRGASQVDDRSDVYSLGVLLYELLAGRPPFTASGHGELMMQHMLQPPPPLQQVCPSAPDSVVSLVEVLLAKDRAARPTMRQVAQQLARLLADASECVVLPHNQRSQLVGGTPVSHRSLSTVPQSIGELAQRRTTTRRQLARVVAVCTTLGLTGVATYFVQQVAEKQRHRAAPAHQPTAHPTLQPRNAEEAPQQEGAKAPVLPATIPDPPLIAKLANTSPKKRSKQVTPKLTSQQSLFVNHSIQSTPSGASILREDTGEQLGTTPWFSGKARSNDRYSVMVVKPGYVTQVVTLRSNQEQFKSVTLEPVGPPGTPLTVPSDPPSLHSPSGNRNARRFID